MAHDALFYISRQWKYAPGHLDLETKGKKKFEWSDVWPEAKELVWRYRRRMALGFLLLIVSRTAGMVLPASTKFLIDDVIGQGKVEYLKWIAIAAIGATLVNAATSFTLTVLLGVAGQRAIADLRRRVQRHIGRLPVSYYENHKSGEMISVYFFPGCSTCEQCAEERNDDRTDFPLECAD